MERLQVEAPDLVQTIGKANDEKRQALKLAACLYVMPLLTEVDDELLKDVCKLLNEGQPASTDLLAKLESLSWSFDKDYLSRAERGEDYQVQFTHARGLAALHFALENNSIKSLQDCIYEICHAYHDNQELFLKFVRSLLV